MPSRDVKKSGFGNSRAQLLGAAALGGVVSVLAARNFCTGEKRIRHRITADYTVEDDVFKRTMGQLLGPPMLENNEVTILQNGDEIFPAMLAGIRSAQRTITMENFLLKEGKVANAFVDALIERADAGVKVHLLQDAMGCSSVYGSVMNRLRRSRVDLEVFRFFSPTQMNFRTHRKLLVIDGGIAFIGGVGIADDWRGDGCTAGCWRDTHYRIRGTAAAQAQQAFIDNWMQTRGELLHGADYFPKLEPCGERLCQVFKSSAGEGSDNARLMLLLSIAAARKRVCIANAYFIPGTLCRRTMVEACRRGVKVEIITPGPDFDSQRVRMAGKSRWRPLLEAGARIYEYQPARYHCKYIIIDDLWASVGSANFDNRSLCLNEEANLNVMDRTFCAEHLRIFEEDKARSHEVTLDEWERRPLREKVVGAVAGLLRSQM
jgi:cardiolipin synthase